MARKITLTFLDEKVAKTTGWPLRYAARQLGIWPDKTNHELYRHFVHWLDQSKYRLSTVWRNGRKLWRIFLAGYPINEQITVTVNELADMLMESLAITTSFTVTVTLRLSSISNVTVTATAGYLAFNQVIVNGSLRSVKSRGKRKAATEDGSISIRSMFTIDLRQ